MTTITVMPRRLVYRLMGSASLRFLHDVSAQDVESMQPGASALAVFLDDKGRILADARVRATEDGAIVDAELAAAEGLERAIARVAPLAGVEVQREEWEMLRLEGDQIPSTELEAIGVLVLPVTWGGRGWDLLAPSLGPAREALRQGGASLGEFEAAEEARIRDGRPRFGIDIDESTLVNETPLVVHAVSFTKGCYPGQESVARVHNLGRVRKRVRALEIVHGSAEPADTLTRDGAEVGRLTSVAGSFAVGTVDAECAPESRLESQGATLVLTSAGWE